LHFLPYARFFAGQGGHDPSGPMVNTPVGVTMSLKYTHQ